MNTIRFALIVFLFTFSTMGLGPSATAAAAAQEASLQVVTYTTPTGNYLLIDNVLIVGSNSTDGPTATNIVNDFPAPFKVVTYAVDDFNKVTGISGTTDAEPIYDGEDITEYGVSFDLKQDRLVGIQLPCGETALDIVTYTTGASFQITRSGVLIAGSNSTDGPTATNIVNGFPAPFKVVTYAVDDFNKVTGISGTTDAEPIYDGEDITEYGVSFDLKQDRLVGIQLPCGETALDNCMYATQNLNFRSEPDQNSDRLGRINVNTCVHVTGYDDSGQWAMTTLDGKTGWASTQYLANSPAAHETTPATFSCGNAIYLVSDVVQTISGQFNVPGFGRQDSTQNVAAVVFDLDGFNWRSEGGWPFGQTAGYQPGAIDDHSSVPLTNVFVYENGVATLCYARNNSTGGNGNGNQNTTPVMVCWGHLVVNGQPLFDTSDGRGNADVVVIMDGNPTIGFPTNGGQCDGSTTVEQAISYLHAPSACGNATGCPSVDLWNYSGGQLVPR